MKKDIKKQKFWKASAKFRDGPPPQSIMHFDVSSHFRTKRLAEVALRSAGLPRGAMRIFTCHTIESYDCAECGAHHTIKHDIKRVTTGKV